MTDIYLGENIHENENKSVNVEGTIMVACLKIIIYIKTVHKSVIRVSRNILGPNGCTVCSLKFSYATITA